MPSVPITLRHVLSKTCFGLCFKTFTYWIILAGDVITTTSSPVVTLSPPTTQCTPVTTTIIQQSFTSGAQEACKEETANCTVLIGGLGGLTALMTLLLVLVVLGCMDVFMLQEEELHYKGEVRNYS